MTEEVQAIPCEIGGRMISIHPPTEGQAESLARIQRALERGTDDDPAQYWAKQMDRLGTVLEHMIVEADRDIVEQMYLTGKISSIELMNTMFAAIREASKPAGQVNEVVAVTKANGARVRRK